MGCKMKTDKHNEERRQGKIRSKAEGRGTKIFYKTYQCHIFSRKPHAFNWAHWFTHCNTQSCTPTDLFRLEYKKSLE